MENENLSLLRALHDNDRAEIAARRRALWTSLALVGAAAVILGALLFSGYRKLSSVQAKTAREEARLDTLGWQVGTLRRQVDSLAPLVENYQASLAYEKERSGTPDTLPTDSQGVAAPGDTTPPLPDTTRVGTTGTTGIQPPPTPAQLPPRVYLQIVTAGDRAYANAVGERLEGAGFRVLGVEHVRNAAPLRNTELRYYKRADEPDAQRLLQALRVAGEPNAVLLYLGLENNTRVRPRHYEIWFAAGAGQAGRRAAPAP
jgi:hypothetical protein